MPVPTPATTEVETHDDNGYEIIPEPSAPTIPAPPVANPAAPVIPAPEIKSATGYGAPEEVIPPVEPVEPPVEKKPEDMTDEEKAVKEIKDSVAVLSDKFDKNKIEKFAIDNKLSKAQIDAYVILTKAEEAKVIADQAAAKVKYRNDSINELKADPDFGGENFIKNVDRVDKLLENNMPNVKKMLTEKGGVLPPYLMKDLLSLSKALNPIAPLVIGEPPAPPEDESNFLDDMYGTK